MNMNDSFILMSFCLSEFIGLDHYLSSESRIIRRDEPSIIWKLLFGNCIHQGCNFHWCQAILKKIRDLKLSSAYNKKGPNPIRDFVFRLLCLAYLPSVFDGLRDSAPQELARLLEYMDKNWIRGRFWTPENWSSFNLLPKCRGR